MAIDLTQAAVGVAAGLFIFALGVGVGMALATARPPKKRRERGQDGLDLPCPACGKTYRAGAAFCNRCGRELADG
jgi:hypothetical protein